MKTQEIYDYIERLGNLLRNEIRREGSEYGLQPVQLEALRYLSMCNRYSDTPMAVTEYLGQTKGTVSQTLKVLEKKALLSKHPDSNDKRITHLKVTESGEKLLNRCIPPAMLNEAGKGLTKNEQDHIYSSLRELLLAVQVSNNMKTFGVCHSCQHNQKNDDGTSFCNLTKEYLSSEEIQLICREHKKAA